MNVFPRITCLLGLLAVPLLAARAAGQVIQLPEFRIFSANTTVSVPDRGAAYLGGVRRAASSSTSRGVPGLSKIPGVSRLTRNRAISAEHSASGAQVRVTIMDLAEMDRALLAEGTARRGRTDRDRRVQWKANFLTRHVARRPALPAAAESDPRSPAPPPVAGVGRNQLADSKLHEEAKCFLERGRAAEAAGKIGVARIYYGMVERRSSGALHEEAVARLEALARAAPAAACFAPRAR